MIAGGLRSVQSEVRGWKILGLARVALGVLVHKKRGTVQEELAKMLRPLQHGFGHLD